MRGAVGRNEIGNIITFFMMPGKGNVRKRTSCACVEHTSFPFGEGYVTSRFILDKFDLDLSSSCLLVRLWLVIIIVVVAGALSGVLVVDERVFADGRPDVSWQLWVILWGSHIHSPLALAHNLGRCGGEVRRD